MHKRKPENILGRAWLSEGVGSNVCPDYKRALLIVAGAGRKEVGLLVLIKLLRCRCFNLFWVALILLVLSVATSIVSWECSFSLICFLQALPAVLLSQLSLLLRGFVSHLALSTLTVISVVLLWLDSYDLTREGNWIKYLVDASQTLP